MKITFDTDSGIRLGDAKHSIGVDLASAENTLAVCCTDKTPQDSVKYIALPGEFDIGGVLMKSFFSDASRAKLIFKIVINDLPIAVVGDFCSLDITTSPDQFGENIAVLLINPSSGDPKEIKNYIEKLSPRVAVIYGNNDTCRSALVPKPIENNELIITASSFPDDAITIFATE